MPVGGASVYHQLLDTLSAPSSMFAFEGERERERGVRKGEREPAKGSVKNAFKWFAWQARPGRVCRWYRRLYMQPSKCIYNWVWLLPHWRNCLHTYTHIQLETTAHVNIAAYGNVLSIYTVYSRYCWLWISFQVFVKINKKCWQIVSFVSRLIRWEAKPLAPLPVPLSFLSTHDTRIVHELYTKCTCEAINEKPASPKATPYVA